MERDLAEDKTPGWLETSKGSGRASAPGGCWAGRLRQERKSRTQTPDEEEGARLWERQERPARTS